MVIFDLDGTLVDSAPEIHAAIEHAWTVVMGDALFPRERFRIGPPLPDVVAALSPDLSEAERDALVIAFRAYYDASDFSATLPYPGILEVLDALAARGVPLAVATNKRLAPSVKVLDRWFAGRFPRIACIDGVTPNDGTLPASKEAMLRWLGGDSAVLVGDTVGDVEAARAAGVRVIAVTWGYEAAATLATAAPDALVHDAAALLAALAHQP